MANVMEFPDTVEEFMELYRVTDTDHVYSNGTDYVPIFRMRQWFEHLQSWPVTRGDKLRDMTDEELAELIGDNIDCSICKKEVFKTTTCPGSLTADGKDCYGCWLDWLKQAAEEDDNGV